MQKGRELLELLERASDRGMDQIVAQYTLLLCTVAARRVSDTEEIKDIVNETFLEFYAHRERFDPEKGSLKAYLSTITDRLAVKQYWELSRLNTVSSGEPVDAHDWIAATELKNDLAAVLDTVAEAVKGDDDAVTVRLTAVEKEALNDKQQAALESVATNAVIVEVKLVITHADGGETELHELGAADRLHHAGRRRGSADKLHRRQCGSGNAHRETHPPCTSGCLLQRCGCNQLLCGCRPLGC